MSRIHVGTLYGRNRRPSGEIVILHEAEDGFTSVAIISSPEALVLAETIAEAAQIAEHQAKHARDESARAPLKVEWPKTKT